MDINSLFDQIVRALAQAFNDYTQWLYAQWNSLWQGGLREKTQEGLHSLAQMPWQKIFDRVWPMLPYLLIGLMLIDTAMQLRWRARPQQAGRPARRPLRVLRAQKDTTLWSKAVKSVARAAGKTAALLERTLGEAVAVPSQWALERMARCR